jgi:hypothetical protein
MFGVTAKLNGPIMPSHSRIFLQTLQSSNRFPYKRCSASGTPAACHIGIEPANRLTAVGPVLVERNCGKRRTKNGTNDSSEKKSCQSVSPTSNDLPNPRLKPENRELPISVVAPERPDTVRVLRELR